MMTSALEDLLTKWATAWSSHDSNRVLAIFTADCIYEDVTFGVKVRGTDELRGFADACFAAVPDFAFELESRFASGSHGAMEWVMSGTHEGDFPGMPATGKRFSGIRGATVVDFEGTKIRRCSDYWDAATFMKQVGLRPA